MGSATSYRSAVGFCQSGAVVHRCCYPSAEKNHAAKTGLHSCPFASGRLAAWLLLSQAYLHQGQCGSRRHTADGDRINRPGTTGATLRKHPKNRPMVNSTGSSTGTGRTVSSVTVKWRNVMKGHRLSAPCLFCTTLSQRPNCASKQPLSMSSSGR